VAEGIRCAPPQETPPVKTIAITIAALLAGASQGALAQPMDQGYGAQGYSQGQSQGYPGQGYPPPAYQGSPPDQGGAPYAPQGQGYANPAYPAPGYQGQGYQGQGNPQQPYPGQGYQPGPGPAPDDANAQAAQQYEQSMGDYDAQLRAYQRQKRQYDRQRAAYEAQFGADTPYNYPPPQPPPPPAGWRDEGPGFYRYSQTMPFHEGPWVDRDHGPGWYRDHGCRLAPAHDGSGGYVPVCPDADGRYRPAA
jgi:hypothetical protein